MAAGRNTSEQPDSVSRLASVSDPETAPVEEIGERPRKRIGRRIAAVAAAVIVAGFLIPQDPIIPVTGATSADWNPETFWYEPWGISGVHKGIDIFGTREQDVVASTGGIVLYSGSVSRGGNVVVVLGPRWRVHYYAHLGDIDDTAGRFVSSGTRLGSVGDSGNALGKQPHLHYAIVTLIPYPWRITTDTQGWKRMFYLDPGELLPES